MLKGMLGLGWQYVRTKHPRLLLAFILIIISGLMAHCVHRVMRHSTFTPPIIYQNSRLIIPENSAMRSVIHTEPVHMQAVVTTVVVPATVQAIPANVVTVLPPLTGQITKINKIIGEPVAVGDPLYSIVAPDLAQALADKTSAEAVYVFAEKNLKRQRDLAKLSINATRDLEQAVSDMAQAKAELDRSVARLRALRVSPEDQDTSGNLIIRSPVNGVVTEIDGGVGTFWADLTTSVVTVADLSKVYVIASAQEHDVPDFFVGQEAEVVWEFTKKTQTAQVDFLEPILNPDTRTVRVGVALDNIDDTLRPNMFARMKFKRKPRQRILLPMTAVIQRGFDSIVFVEVAPWQFVPRIVKVGLQMDDKIEVESGLADGERVAMTGGIILND